MREQLWEAAQAGLYQDRLLHTLPSCLRPAGSKCNLAMTDAVIQISL